MMPYNTMRQASLSYICRADEIWKFPKSKLYLDLSFVVFIEFSTNSSVSVDFIEFFD